MAAPTRDERVLSTVDLTNGRVLFAYDGLVSGDSGITWDNDTQTLTVANFVASTAVTLPSNVVTLTGTQTLTNKTITAPKLSDKVDFVAGAAPATPAAGETSLYAQSGGDLAYKRADGQVVPLGAVVVRATSALSVANSTTLTDVPGMSVSLAAATAYLVRARLRVTCSDAGGIKYQLAFSSNPTTRNHELILSDVTGGAPIPIDRQESANGAISFDGTIGSGQTELIVEINAVVVTNAATTMKVQGAQSVSDATPTVFGTRSFMEAIRLAA